MKIWSDNTKGAAMMAAAMSAYTLNDACMKGMSGVIPLGQAVFLRGIGTILLLGIMAVALGQLRLNIGRRDWVLIGLRSLMEAAAALFFLTAIFNMPLSNATAIMQALPLTVSLGAALVLRERLGWRRLLAILIGFVGVLLVVRPGTDGFNIYSVSALMAVLAVTLRDLVVRKISTTIPTMTVALVAATGVTVVFGIITLWDDWQPVSVANGVRFLGATIAIVGGYVLSVSAMRVGEIGFIAPFRYTALVFGILSGILFFGERPSALTYLGAAIIMATGLFTLYRERRAGRGS